VSFVPDDRELGPLEMQVLGLLDGSESLSVQELKERLKAAGSDLAYTTVMTILVRLHEKAIVVRHKDGRRFLYKASRSAPALRHGILARIQRTLFKNDRTRPIMTLLDDEHLTQAELKALRKAIDEKLKASR
jgi:predicted transcriptional regulator